MSELSLRTECVFLPNLPEKNGYVRVSRGGVRKGAHQWAYEDMYGPIPAGYVVDHLCHNADPNCLGGVCKHRSCINPGHLAAKTSGANTLAGDTPAARNAAKTHCSQGHAFTPSNTYLGPTKGDRQCRMCKLLHHQRKFAARKAEEWGLGTGDIAVVVS